MSRKHRANERAERRRKRGLNADGTHRNDYEGMGGTPGAKQKNRIAIESADGTNEPRGGRIKYHTRKLAGGEVKYRAVLLYDRDAEIGLVIGEDLPDRLGGSGRVFDIGDGRKFRATVVRDITNPQNVRKDAEGKSVKIDYIQIVGNKGFVPGNGTAEFYGEQRTGGRHAFGLIEESPARNSKLVEDILAQVSNIVPVSPREKDYSGGWRSDYGRDSFGSGWGSRIY